MREWRKAHRIKASDIAEALNISDKYYYDLESGRKRINADQLVALAEKFKVRPGYVLGVEKSPALAEDSAMYYLEEKERIAAKIDDIIQQINDVKSML